MRIKGVKAGNWRMYVLAILTVLIACAIVLRLFYIQIKSHALYRSLANDQHQITTELAQKRGEIFFQDRSKKTPDGSPSLFSVAVTKQGYFAYAVPAEVPKESLDETSARLASFLNVDKEIIERRLAKRADPFEPIKRKLSDAEADAVRRADIPGVKLGKESWRYYPLKDLGASLTGYVGASHGGTEKGLYGVERQYDALLAGMKGYAAGERDALGSLIPFRTKTEKPSEDGSDLVLTIDANIQFAAERVLRSTLKKWESPGGTVVVLEPSTGKVLALVDEPTYDPNAYGEVKDVSLFLNDAVERIFEPGSVFKPVTMASALEEGLVTPRTTYTDEGIVRIGGYAIRNFDGKAYGVRTMSEVIELSLNTGAVHAERLLGRERFVSYVKKFGFGEKLGIDLPGEIRGNIANLKERAEINFATASFGQGISVTPLQMANAVAAIANGGKLMRPYVVERIVHPDGSVEIIEPKEIRRVVSTQAGRDMTRMMVDAVRGKFERRADVSGYFVAGKTGTAQIPDPKTGGYLPVEEGVIHSFVGYAPAFAPRFLVFIKMDKPVGVRFAANSLTPAFHDLAVYLLNYFSIPPDEP